jgi:tetratricopeptide (TPR) repeat protein
VARDFLSGRRVTPAFAIAALAIALPLLAQTAPSASPTPADALASAADIRQPGGKLVLVLPFENRSGQPNLAWIGDSFPWTLGQRLNSAGFLALGRDDREYAMEHLGLPADFKPSRASTIRIAQQLDADYVIVGSYNIANPGTSAARIDVQAQLLEVNALRLSPPITGTGPLPTLFDVENALAWRVARRMDPHFAVAQQTFLAASGGVGLSAFEDYIRGISAPTPEERLKRLADAVAAAPNYTPALLELGKEEYAAREYDEAAATLAKVPAGDRFALEASFYGGLARFNTAKYTEAEKAFAFVASRLPLPEVVNDQAVAASRQGKDAVALFQQVITTDPNDADYHFNLAVALLGRNDISSSLHEVETALKLHGDDDEAKELQSRLQSLHGVTANWKTALYADGFSPTTRIRRTWSEASVRQIAFQLDQMRAIQMSALPPHERSVEYAKLGDGYLAQGLMPEAEQEFQSALSADADNAAAHAGIAQVRERTGSTDDARTEAQTSLRIAPSVNAWLVLARLDLAANQLSASASDVANALKIEPANAAALGIRQSLAARGQSVP